MIKLKTNHYYLTETGNLYKIIRTLPKQKKCSVKIFYGHAYKGIIVVRNSFLKKSFIKDLGDNEKVVRLLYGNQYD